MSAVPCIYCVPLWFWYLFFPAGQQQKHRTNVLWSTSPPHQTFLGGGIKREEAIIGTEWTQWSKNGSFCHANRRAAGRRLNSVYSELRNSVSKNSCICSCVGFSYIFSVFHSPGGVNRLDFTAHEFIWARQHLFPRKYKHISSAYPRTAPAPYNYPKVPAVEMRRCNCICVCVFQWETRNVMILER